MVLTATAFVIDIGAGTFIAFDTADAAPSARAFAAYSPSVWTNPMVARSEIDGDTPVPLGRRIEVGAPVRDWIVQVVAPDDLLVDAPTGSGRYLVPVTTERLGVGPVADTPQFVVRTTGGELLEPEKGLGCPSNPAPYQPVEPGSGISAGFLCFEVVGSGVLAGSVLEVGGPEDPVAFEIPTP